MQFVGNKRIKIKKRTGTIIYLLLGAISFLITTLLLRIHKLQDDLLLAKLSLSEEESLLSKLTRISQPGNPNLKRKRSQLSLFKFEKRAKHVKDYCEQLSAKELNEYESPAFEYWDSWGWEEDEDDSFSTRNKRENEDKTEAPPERPSLTFHKDFHQHGPTAIAPAYNLLVSVPEKCGSEFWFAIVEYLNFPQPSWPKNSTDKKHYQRKHILPMISSIDGASESIMKRGSTVAVVRHPFLRVYSAYTGFFKGGNLYRDREFAFWWTEQSGSFYELFDKYPEIRENIDDLKATKETFQSQSRDFFTFQHFIEFLIIELTATEKSKHQRTWRESGNDHINPIFAILQPCKYEFQYFVKVEHLSSESRALFSALDIHLPDQYLLPAHKSTSTGISAEMKVKEAYKDVKLADRRKLAEFYKLDLEIFEYTVRDDANE
ncbi:unnamed protein product [Oikopleura dioica]|uniref:Carbohydrate sulfotransferase n=1 Tax=Oikopleura dioica TaxID=34765 RepID=E4X5V8_OIKDI|nr:unnamed protein product [Oikopleura dioica]